MAISPIPTVNMYVRRGDGEVYTLPVTLPDGTAVNLTGAKLWYTAKRKLTDADTDAVIRKDTFNLLGIVITSAIGGTAELTLLPADTSGEEGIQVRLFHDAQVQLSGGQPHTLFNGVLVIEPDVTQRTT